MVKIKLPLRKKSSSLKVGSNAFVDVEANNSEDFDDDLKFVQIKKCDAVTMIRKDKVYELYRTKSGHYSLKDLEPNQNKKCQEPIKDDKNARY
jgi:hypothetical protein